MEPFTRDFPKQSLVDLFQIAEIARWLTFHGAEGRYRQLLTPDKLKPRIAIHNTVIIERLHPSSDECIFFP